MTTLLDWLRDHRGLKGTKEGCAEGDCGACTVVLERADGRHEAMNSCIAMLGQMDGQSIRTVEGLLGTDGTPHPVQRVLAEADATQCGFCTPGFVMTAYAFAAGGEPPELETIHDALAGNLCRCTGYRPIVDAMKKVAGVATEPAAPPPPRTAVASVRRHLLRAALARRARGACAPGIPRRCCWPAAPISACWPAASRKPPKAVIHVAHVPELNVIDAGEKHLTFGAAVTYARAMPVLVEAFPALRTYLARLGSRQIRTLGTIGGNLGNASPIGDMPPVLLALETTVKLVSRARRARIAAGGVLRRLPQDRAGARRGDPELHPAAPVAGRDASIATRSASGATRTSRPSPAPIACASRTAGSRMRGSPSAAWRRRPSAPATPRRRC